MHPCWASGSDKDQIDDLLYEIRERAKKEERVLVTTLTKRMAEELNDFMARNGVKAKYIHSDVETLERIEILRQLRLGLGSAPSANPVRSATNAGPEA